MSTTSSDTMERLVGIMRSTLKLDESEAIDQDMPLIGGRHDLDSLDVLLLITTIEREFGVRIREGEVDRSAFASLRSLAEFVERLRGAP
ncbi:MAG: phosphopantetheine-binding protein [Phycisphaerales bacterium]